MNKVPDFLEIDFDFEEKLVFVIDFWIQIRNQFKVLKESINSKINQTIRYNITKILFFYYKS